MSERYVVFKGRRENGIEQMIITVLQQDKTLLRMEFYSHDAIDKMVATLKENCPDWSKITIDIEKITPHVQRMDTPPASAPAYRTMTCNNCNDYAICGLRAGLWLCGNCDKPQTTAEPIYTKRICSICFTIKPCRRIGSRWFCDECTTKVVDNAARPL